MITPLDPVALALGYLTLIGGALLFALIVVGLLGGIAQTIIDHWHGHPLYVKGRRSW